MGGIALWSTIVTLWSGQGFDLGPEFQQAQSRETFHYSARTSIDVGLPHRLLGVSLFNSFFAALYDKDNTSEPVMQACRSEASSCNSQQWQADTGKFCVAPRTGMIQLAQVSQSLSLAPSQFWFASSFTALGLELSYR